MARFLQLVSSSTLPDLVPVPLSKTRLNPYKRYLTQLGYIRHLKQYQAYHRPGKPLKNLKLVNYDKPAILLSFFFKHKYSIERQVIHADVVQHIKSYRDELLNRSLMEQLSVGQLKELKQTDELLRRVREEAHAYQACCSNYHHKYYYWYCTYRWVVLQKST
ncbi:hypothetical protein [Spirosoma endophyticum]|uniref:Uncharacterized protein n=1 Tax=Spirosoma endophyticum TaxID=662367 RepID=A0A1I2IDP7_9BACT|nr:hypothetical protein [Spirosoma endophyticum]SFF39760.1 hypothetical protein SAMN05216167_1661 [Spirosoma endophyticum]